MIKITLEGGEDKASAYRQIFQGLQALFSDEKDLIANMANLCAVLKENFDFLWVGFYINRNEELVLGPFQGPLACTRIAIGKGVCGAAASSKKTIIVDDVDAFPGHIACSSLSKSEIVIPAVKNNRSIFVLDIDSEHYSSFDTIDKDYLEKICRLLVESSDADTVL